MRACSQLECLPGLKLGPSPSRQGVYGGVASLSRLLNIHINKFVSRVWVFGFAQ